MPTVVSTRHEEEHTCAFGHTPTRLAPPPAVGDATAAVALGAGLVATPAQAAAPSRSDLVTQRLPWPDRGRWRPTAARAALARPWTDPGGEPQHRLRGRGRPIGASTFTSFIQEDVPTIETLNAAGLEVSAAGNHEFDQGWDDLRVALCARISTRDWEYIAANVHVKCHR